MSDIHVLSPGAASFMIDEKDVTVERLCSILSGAVIENEIQDSRDIYAHDGVSPPLWIRLDRGRKLIWFLTYYPPNKEESSIAESKVLSIVNLINIEHVIVQFYWFRNEFWGAYWMTYDTRLDPRQFIKMLRRYSEAFESGVAKFRELAC